MNDTNQHQFLANPHLNDQINCDESTLIHAGQGPNMQLDEKEQGILLDDENLQSLNEINYNNKMSIINNNLNISLTKITSYPNNMISNDPHETSSPDIANDRAQNNNLNKIEICEDASHPTN